MDQNKNEALARAGYRIPPSCGLCVHARLASGSAWGTCKVIPYEHLKHSGPQREASIWRGGVCDAFSAAADLVRQLGAFAPMFGETSSPDADA